MYMYCSVEDGLSLSQVRELTCSRSTPRDMLKLSIMRRRWRPVLRGLSLATLLSFPSAPQPANPLQVIMRSQCAVLPAFSSSNHL